MNNTPSRQARIDAGFTVEQAAKKIGRAPSGLTAMERKNKYPLHVAEPLSRLYGCKLGTFLSRGK